MGLNASSRILIMKRRKTWINVLGWEGFYQVSDSGGVRSVDRIVTYERGKANRRHKLQGKRLKQITDKDGYKKVWLGRKGQGKMHFVHTLVLNSFVGPRPESLVARHLDGVSSNNLKENLCWGTWEEQAADRRKHGTAPIGDNHHRTKIKSTSIPDIKNRLQQGETQKSIAKTYGVGRMTIQRIVRHYKLKTNSEGL